MASISTEYQDRLRVLFLASEWGSNKGGLSTINRELAINIAKSPEVDVTLFVLRCSDDDKNAALRHKINLVKAKRHPGMDELQWLSLLPDDLHSDVVVGHGSKFGPQAYIIRRSQKCKWVQVVHTVPEELGMHKTYANPIAGAERKHKREVELCESADFVVPIGPKLYEVFRCYLSSCKKGEMIFNFTPGIFSEFLEVEQVAEREGKFQVLLFGRGDKEDFLVKGFDIAAKAVASLENIKLVFVGATEGELEDVKDNFLECGIEANNLTVRSFLQDRESLKSLFCEVDLAVMPSRTEGFGLAALEALSAGLPILVSKNSGFGEALSKVQFGPYFVVNSNDPQVWANAIKRLQDRDRCDRLEESELLRYLYGKKYSWEKQCKEFISKMASAVEGLFKQSQRVTFQEASQQTGVSSGCPPDYSESHQEPQVKERVNLLQDYTQAAGETHGESVVDFESVMLHFSVNGTGQLPNMRRDSAQDTDGNQVICPEELLNKEDSGSPFEEFPAYLQKIKLTHDSWPSEESVNKLRVAVECKNTEILDQLWRDYRSGHLNVVAEKCLLTDDIKRRFHLKSVKLKTTILEEDYLACKAFLLNNSTNGEERNSHNHLDLHDIRGHMNSTEPTSVSAKTSEVKGKVVDQNREEEDESKTLNQQPRTENKSKKEKRNKPTKESEESAQTISSSDHKMKEGAISSKGGAHAAVNYLEEPDKIMSVKGRFTETSPLVGALPLNTKTLRLSSQANVDSDTANLAQQNVQQTRKKPCQSNGGTPNADGMIKDKRENPKKVVRCIPRTRGFPGRCVSYEKGSVLDAKEDGELEFKSLVSAPSCSLPWKIMEEAKKFICACLNADRQGTIYFGVGDSQEKGSKYHPGEIIGLDVEQMRGEINKAFQFVLDDHIKSDAGPLQKGGEQNCTNMYFVPVKSQGTRSHSFVIEIEVARDWQFCKDKVYYSKRWIEKRGVYKACGEKRALSDFFKVKDEFDNVTIRANGASTSIKPYEVESQVKKPLEVKYKDWRKKTKQDAYEIPEAELSLEDADAKSYSDVLRGRLRELNFKENGFVLIANKLPAKYRGTARLSFLQKIPWVAVFDLFDPSSKEDGLHHACNETRDAPQAKSRTLDEFKETTLDKDSLISTRRTTWIFNNEEMQKGDWIKCSKDCLYRALSAYKRCFPPGNLICVFLCLSETAVHEMADIMETSFSILGNSARSCVTIISESRTVVEPFLKASKQSLQKELGECSVPGIPLSLLKEIVLELVGPSEFEEKDATTELPYFTGFKEVLNKTINSWDDLELYCPNPRLPRLPEEIEKERGAFYKGSQISQVNLFHGHSIPRSLEKDVSAKVTNALKSQTKENVFENYYVKTVTVYYEPGSGATTLCRRVLWSKRGEYRCAVVKAITSSTDYQIEKLQRIGYDEWNIQYSRPVLVLVDNFPESDVRFLSEHTKMRRTRCVFLTTFPISKTTSNLEITLRKLDEEETTRVKDILNNITGIDSERRGEAQQVLQREKRFIWFGLELFGREYVKIKETLQNHIGNILGAFLGERGEEHKMLLAICCFFNKYSNGNIILPHSVVLDFLYLRLSGTETKSPRIQDIHEAFGGLLLEVPDEKHGFYGWRPAHPLVSEVVKSRINVEETAVLALEKVVQGKAHVMKFFKQQVFKLFLDRRIICDPVLLKEQAAGDGAFDTDLENEVFGLYGRRTRYSPVIEEILEREGNVREAGAMKVLLTVCEQVTQTEEKAYAWQQLARFMGYEMRTKVMDENDDLHERLYKAMKKESTIKHPMPRNGIDAAHKAVDIAVSLQPSDTNYYNSKGVLYLLQLKYYKPPLLRSLPEAVEICRKALEVYDKALATSKGPNHLPMIGKIQAIILLLEIIKELPCFNSEDMKFTRYLKEGDAPLEVVEVLSFEQQNFVQNLSSTILDVLNELFGSLKIKQATTYDDSEIRSLDNAKIRGSNLRRKFYEIAGLDRTELSREKYSFLLSSPSQDLALYQEQVQDILYIKDETPYSSWSNLDNSHVNLIYQLLKSLCLRGHGSHNEMLICSKACLHLEDKPPVEDLDKIVTIFVEKFPNSEWANLFYYMIHFPIPNIGLAQYTSKTKRAIKKCANIVQEKVGSRFRKSGAEYFLGKGTGLNAIVNSYEFQWLETKWKTKTKFWRGKEPSEKLKRVKGQKEVGGKGIISFRGLQINFDNTLYPNESKEDLWFYLGFTVAGPYAYDPVDNETYVSFQRQSASLPATLSTSFESSTYSSQLSNNTSNRGARRKPRSFLSNRTRGRIFSLKDKTKENDSSDPEFSHDILEASDGSKDDWITVGGRFNALIEWESVQDTDKEPGSRWNGNKQALSQDQWQIVRTMTPKGKERQAKAGGVKGKSAIGRGGSMRKCFNLKLKTPEGKLHHGAHKLESGSEETDLCNYTHVWSGDTRQFVFKKCPHAGKLFCNKEVEHEPFIWNPVFYPNRRWQVWKDEEDVCLSTSWGSLESIPE